MAEQNTGAASAASELTRIKGIGEKTAEGLEDQGISTLVALADLNADEIERIEEELDIRGKLAGYKMQAAALLSETTPPPAPPTRPMRVDAKQEPKKVNGNGVDVAALQQQLADLQKQIARMQEQPTTLAARRRTQAPMRARTMLMAREDGEIRLRLNRNEKFSEVIGADSALPPGSVLQQVVLQDGEKRVAYFGNDDVQRFCRDEEADEIDLDNVEPEHVPTISQVNFRNWLDDKVEYPPGLILAAMKERLGFEGRTIKEAKDELHRVIRRNRA